MPTTRRPTAPSTGSPSGDGICRLVCVAPSRVAALWPFARPLIAAAMRRGGISDFSGVERDVLGGSALLWLGWDGQEIVAAAVTELALIHGRKVCTIVACGGRARRRWLHLLAELETFARREGCQATRMYARRGWTRVLPDYRATRVILEKELSK
jgi:hypothetical protein